MQLNDVAGAQVVSVPDALQLQRENAPPRSFFYLFIGVFGFLFVTINFLLYRLVVNPVRRLRSIADQLSLGEMDAPKFPGSDRDEIASLGTSLERMRRSFVEPLKMIDDGRPSVASTTPSPAGPALLQDVLVNPRAAPLSGLVAGTPAAAGDASIGTDPSTALRHQLREDARAVREPVEMTIFGPSAVTRRERFFIQAVFHRPRAAKEAYRAASVAQNNPQIAQRLSLVDGLHDGTWIQVKLGADSRVTIDEPQQILC